VGAGHRLRAHHALDPKLDAAAILTSACPTRPNRYHARAIALVTIIYVSRFLDNLSDNHVCNNSKSSRMHPPMQANTTTIGNSGDCSIFRSLLQRIRHSRLAPAQCQADQLRRRLHPAGRLLTAPPRVYIFEIDMT